MENLTYLPVAFKNWVLAQLGVMRDGGLVDEGSDREWTYDEAGEWHRSMQHVQDGKLETILPDAPMGGTVFIYDDICYHW